MNINIKIGLISFVIWIINFFVDINIYIFILSMCFLIYLLIKMNKYIKNESVVNASSMYYFWYFGIDFVIINLFFSGISLFKVSIIKYIVPIVILIFLAVKVIKAKREKSKIF